MTFFPRTTCGRFEQMLERSFKLHNGLYFYVKGLDFVVVVILKFSKNYGSTELHLGKGNSNNNNKSSDKIQKVEVKKRVAFFLCPT